MLKALVLDTSVALSAKELRSLALKASAKSVDVYIPAQTYLENRRQELIRHGSTFNRALFDSFLGSIGIQTVSISFTHHDAIRWSERLAVRYPASDDWTKAKLRTIGGELHRALAVLPGRVPMTTDWLIALLVEDNPDWFAVTNDKGAEWDALHVASPSRVLSMADALAML
jgi:hypothetical protein